MIRAAVTLLLLLATVGMLVGCGLDVQSPDLFVLTRTGQGSKLTLLVNDSGTIACNGGKARMISSARLITARDLSDNLAKDASANLRLAIGPGSTYTYKIRMQQGTITFSDRDTARRPYLAQSELFAIDAAQQVCGLSG